MRLLIISFYYAPDLCAGSFRTQGFVEALNELNDKDLKVDILTTTPNRYKSFKVKAKSFEQIGNVQINRIKIASHQSGMLDQAYAFIRFYNNVLKLIKSKEYDLVFATSSRLFTAFLGAIVSKRKKIPLFLDLRDILVDNMKCILPWYKRVFIVPILSIVERFTIKQAFAINLVSEGFRGYYFKLAPSKQYSFITNGIDAAFLETDFSNLKNNSTKIITYAGNIGEGQGMDKIVPEMCQFLGDKYVIRIIGSGGKIEALKEKLKEKEITNVELIAPVEREELLRYYRETDYLFLHLNNHQAFEKVLPSKLFEYGGIGKPIIAGVNGYAAQFIKENLDGSLVFNACDIEDFKSKWDDFLHSKATRNNRFSDTYARHNLMKKLANLVLNSQ